MGGVSCGVKPRLPGTSWRAVKSKSSSKSVKRHRKKALIAAASSGLSQIRADRIVPLVDRQWCEESCRIATCAC